MDLGILPRSAVKGLHELDWFRVYDPNNGDITFWSEDFNLQTLLNEAQKILPKLEAEVRKPLEP